MVDREPCRADYDAMDGIRYSFLTCVSDFGTYETLVVASLEEMRAGRGPFERIPVDNTENRLSAAQALNRGISRARGEVLICCHQDIRFPPDWLERLESQLAEIEAKDKRWGVLGTFGKWQKRYYGHVVDHRPGRGRSRCGPLPAVVQTLDENCLILRRDSGLSFDEYMDGFHLYGVDLCLEAMARGLVNYALDCCVDHFGAGVKDAAFQAQKARLRSKWRRRKRVVGRKIHTTCGTIRLGLW